MTCPDCGGSARPFRRGLCNPCYERRRRAGLLHGAPPADRRAGAYVVEEWVHLSSYGLTRAQAAERLGMTKGALEKALTRHARPPQRREVS